MIEKFIIHIKNVIFLKLIMYALVIGALMWVIPVFREDYNNTISRKEKAAQDFSEAAIKLYSIIESENKILDTYRLYEDIVNAPVEHMCILKNKLIDQVKLLASKHNVDSPVTEFNQIFKGAENSNSSEVKIKNYNFNSKFNSADFDAFQSLIKQIYLIMPENSIVTFVQIENNDFLDPEIINKLNLDEKPSLISATFNVRIRELSVK